MQDKTEVLRASYNLVMALLSDIQRYTTLPIQPKFAREINDVTTSLAAYINEIEAKAKEAKNAE